MATLARFAQFDDRRRALKERAKGEVKEERTHQFVSKAAVPKPPENDYSDLNELMARGSRALALQKARATSGCHLRGELEASRLKSALLKDPLAQWEAELKSRRMQRTSQQPIVPSSYSRGFRIAEAQSSRQNTHEHDSGPGYLGDALYNYGPSLAKGSSGLESAYEQIDDVPVDFPPSKPSSVDSSHDSAPQGQVAKPRPFPVVRAKIFNISGWTVVYLVVFIVLAAWIHLYYVNTSLASENYRDALYLNDELYDADYDYLFWHNS